jgi:putative FmdB family regulatory protein
MPTYDYKCEKCGHAMEAFQSIMDNPLKKCPKCGKNGLKRQMGSGGALIFKGSGFYCTDYRKSGSGGGTSSNGTSSSSSSPTDTPSTSTPTSTSKEATSAPKASDSGKKKD